MNNTPLPERKMAPVQGWPQGIPWSLHLEAYAAYCKKWSPQPALIDLEGCNCRGGFGTKELDELIPGWREESHGAMMFSPNQLRKFYEFALAAPPAAPADTVMVPREPTQEHFCRAMRVSKFLPTLDQERYEDWAAEYRAMIAAAPAPAVPDEVLDSLGMHDAAVKLARRLGYTWAGGEWSAAPAVPQEPIYGKYTADDLVRGVLQSAAPAVPLTDADLDRIADAVPVDDIGAHMDGIGRAA